MIRNCVCKSIIYNIIMRTTAPLIISYYLFKRDSNSKQACLLFLYLPFTVLMLCIPIFYRLANYLSIIYVVSCINFLKNRSHACCSRVSISRDTMQLDGFCCSCFKCVIDFGQKVLFNNIVRI